MRPSTACAILAPFGVLLLTSLGCRQTKGCAPNTVFVSLSFSGAAANADTLALTTCIPSGCEEGTVSHIPGATTGSVELTFTSYTPGTSLTLTVTPMNGASALAPPASQSVLLAPGCTAWPFTVGSDTPGGTGGPGGLGAGGDASATGGNGGSAGSAAVGGTTGTGGGFASGGEHGSGGAAATGGVVGSGGRVGAGSGGMGTGGAPPACTGTSRRCSGNDVQMCVNGQWGATVACGTRQTCTGPVGTAKCTCVADPVCTSNAVGNICASTSTLATCMQDANGCFYEAASSMCGGHQTCSGSACACVADPVCKATGTSCATSTTLSTCAADGSCFYQAAGSPSACGGGTVCERLAPASCADPNWAEWPVPPSVSPSSYTDNGGDGTVTDNSTGLMWQSPPATTMTQTAAVTYCATLAAGGHHDWRLPTKIELLSIVDYGRSSPSINPVFTSTASGYYWSSTLLAGGPSYAWSVNFNLGNTFDSAMTFTSNVRCVR